MEFSMSPVDGPSFSEEVVLDYAGFWRRAGAYIIDALILDLLLIPIEIGLGFFKDIQLLLHSLSNPDPSMMGKFLMLDWILVILLWLYYAIMESSRFQATIGKMALGIIVTDEDGYRISFGRATGRHFAKGISFLILCIGYMMAGWTHKKQALHDIMAKTVVIFK